MGLGPAHVVQRFYTKTHLSPKDRRDRMRAELDTGAVPVVKLNWRNDITRPPYPFFFKLAARRWPEGPET